MVAAVPAPDEHDDRQDEADREAAQQRQDQRRDGHRLGGLGVDRCAGVARRRHRGLAVRRLRLAVGGLAVRRRLGLSVRRRRGRVRRGRLLVVGVDRRRWRRVRGRGLGPRLGGVLRRRQGSARRSRREPSVRRRASWSSTTRVARRTPPSASIGTISAVEREQGHRPAAARVVQHADAERADRGEQVAGRLGEARRAPAVPSGVAARSPIRVSTIGNVVDAPRRGRPPRGPRASAARP